MPTTLVVSTVDGFVFASDGLTTDENNTTLSLDARKIFPLTSARGHQLAYGLAGTTKFDFPPGAPIDLHQLLEKAASGLKHDDPRHPQALGNRLCTPAYMELRRAKEDGIIPAFPVDRKNEKGHVIASVLIVGFYRHVPIDMEVCIFHNDQKLGALRPELHGPVGWGGYGPKIIRDILRDPGDERLSAFRIPEMAKDAGITMQEGKRIARNYIRACSSDEGRAIDPVYCPTIGGNIQIATITDTTGFRWEPT